MSNQYLQKKDDIFIVVIPMGIIACAMALCLGCGVIACLFDYAVNQAKSQQPKCPSVPSDWQTIVSDTFDESLFLKWPEIVRDDEYSHKDWNVTNGIYVLKIITHKGVVDRITRKSPVVSDFYLDIDIMQVGGSMDDYYGLVFHDTYKDYYFFAVSDKQRYSVWLFQDGWSGLVDWTPAEIIKPRNYNHLTVFARDSIYIFCINGFFVNRIEGSQIPKGYLGVAVGIDQQEDAEFIFDNFVLSIP